MNKSIAIIGAGPKAAAIAAKAHVLNAFGAGIRVTIFEKHELGANWTGNHGYTDGQARLCTPAEHDLGFPYEAGRAGSDVAARMYTAFSWGSYLVQAPKTAGRDGLSGWVNRGRLPPSHADYARYLQWAIEKSDAKVEFGEVTGIERSPGGWIVRRKRGKTVKTGGGPFGAVVLTGPGPSQSTVARTGSSPRIVDGVQFWKGPEKFLARGRGRGDQIVVIGAGGTAAAVAARVLQVPDKGGRELVIVGHQAALFTRSDAFFERQIFSDEEIWEQLDMEVRSEFTRRLNRGVVWATISDELARSRRVQFVPGRAKEILVAGTKGSEDILVTYETFTGMREAHASLVIDASGFDGWWFAPLLPIDLGEQIVDDDPETQKAKREKLIGGMDPNFVLFSDPIGAIHAPVLSQAVGPGFSTLMVLGAMSDRILVPYI
jgi:mycobactin lysine-N-oxygenase